MDCKSCKHGFCWLCLGDQHVHGGWHKFCSSIEEVKRRGREAYLVVQDDKMDIEVLAEYAKMFTKRNEEKEALERQKEEQTNKFMQLIDSNLGLAREDFDDLL